jgi:hypothetical protein
LFGNSVAAFSTVAIFLGAPGFTIDGDAAAGAVFIKSYYLGKPRKMPSLPTASANSSKSMLAMDRLFSML